MSRWIDISAVLGASIALHVGGLVWLGNGAPQGGGAGDEGVSTLSVVAVNPGYAALAETWQSAPETAQMPELSAPEPENNAIEIPNQDLPAPELEQSAALTAPMVEAMPTQPLPVGPRIAEAPGAVEMPMLRPSEDFPTSARDQSPSFEPAPTLSLARVEAAPVAPLPIAPQIATAPEALGLQPPASEGIATPSQESSPAFVAPTAPALPDVGAAPDVPTEPTGAIAASPRPISRPETQPDPAPAPTASQTQDPAPERPAQAAAGSGGGTSEGTSTQDAAPSPGPPDPSLMANWGGRIAARIAAGVPRTEATGQVTLQIVVARNGRLQSVAIARSSGNPDLDLAAVQVVQRAGRFPRAPSGLTGDSFRFNVPLRFS